MVVDVGNDSDEEGDEAVAVFDLLFAPNTNIAVLPPVVEAELVVELAVKDVNAELVSNRNPAGWLLTPVWFCPPLIVLLAPVAENVSSEFIVSSSILLLLVEGVVVVATAVDVEFVNAGNTSGFACVVATLPPIEIDVWNSVPAFWVVDFSFVFDSAPVVVVVAGVVVEVNVDEVEVAKLKPEVGVVVDLSFVPITGAKKLKGGLESSPFFLSASFGVRSAPNEAFVVKFLLSSLLGKNAKPPAGNPKAVVFVLLSSFSFAFASENDLDSSFPAKEEPVVADTSVVVVGTPKLNVSG
jgi:hypothetical protein